MTTPARPRRIRPKVHPGRKKRVTAAPQLSIADRDKPGHPAASSDARTFRATTGWRYMGS
ncbi:hypothetical protein HXXDennis_68 [Xanthomonas phage HXX_Dennis]|nr:hypothetical protein HXXDennis_68 [Xanthomonas phage HXX_Dennis]